MSPATYKLIHIAGLVLLALGLGAGPLQPRSSDVRPNRLGMILHGTGMLVMLVAGFGGLAKLQIHFPYPAWVYGKIAAWVLIGILPVMHKRGVVPAGFSWFVAFALATAAAWLAINKPVM